jgi:hypothetical protein
MESKPLDQNGEAGLQEALDRIYPTTGLVRKPFGPPLKDSYVTYHYGYPADRIAPTK